MPDSVAELSIPPFDSPGREKAKERLYVILQVASWGGLLAVQLVFSSLLPPPAEVRDRVLPAVIQEITLGLLLTHFARPLIQRWGWKNLGWRALGPRILGLAAVQGLLWSGILCLWQPYVLGWMPIRHVSLLAVFVFGWINSFIFLVGWLCVYFFYHLFNRYNRLEIERLRLGAMAKGAELRALKSQLNPHFIFNALNSLRALIDEDPSRARQAVTQLANLLRYSLQSAQLETVPFEEELRVVTDYLSLEQVRHEERLRMRLDVSDDARQWPVPPMLLQTLVENAVKYGISTRPEGGEIGISARIDGDRLVLRVTNPGHVEPAPIRSKSTGLGLANAAARLRLLTGDKGSLDLRMEGSDSVLAEAIIPLPVLRTDS
ncbi:histidine kinase [Opitutaceae bacterium EW11]|nr:histidine kinase [Opitutaceae bacterium EW11]